MTGNAKRAVITGAPPTLSSECPITSPIVVLDSAELGSLDAFVKLRQHTGDPRWQELARGLRDLKPFARRRPHVAMLLSALLTGEHLLAGRLEGGHAE